MSLLANLIIDDKIRSVATGFVSIDDLDSPVGLQDVNGIGDTLTANMDLPHHRKP